MRDDALNRELSFVESEPSAKVGIIPLFLLFSLRCGCAALFCCSCIITCTFPVAEDGADVAEAPSRSEALGTCGCFSPDEPLRGV